VEVILDEREVECEDIQYKTELVPGPDGKLLKVKTPNGPVLNCTTVPKPDTESRIILRTRNVEEEIIEERKVDSLQKIDVPRRHVGDETVFNIVPKIETEEELVVEMRRIPLDDLMITSDEKKLTCNDKTFTKIKYVEDEDCKDVERRICRDVPISSRNEERESFQDVCHTEYAIECSRSHSNY